VLRIHHFCGQPSVESTLFVVCQIKPRQVLLLLSYKDLIIVLFEVVYIKYSLSMASSAIVENSTNHSSDIVHHARPRFVELLCVCVCFWNYRNMLNLTSQFTF